MFARILHIYSSNHGSNGEVRSSCIPPFPTTAFPTPHSNRRLPWLLLKTVKDYGRLVTSGEEQNKLSESKSQLTSASKIFDFVHLLHSNTFAQNNIGLHKVATHATTHNNALRCSISYNYGIKFGKIQFKHCWTIIIFINIKHVEQNLVWKTV